MVSVINVTIDSEIATLTVQNTNKSDIFDQFR